MMKINILTDHQRRFSIPVPYSFFRVLVSITSSKILWSLINRWSKSLPEKTVSSIIPADPKAIKHFLSMIIRELQSQKGLVLVDVKLHDGPQVIIRL